MLTNQLDIKFNIDNIKRDYTIYRIEKKGSNEKTSIEQILNSIKEEEHALSVRYLFGNQAYLLFQKQIDRKIPKKIMETYHDVTVEEYLLNENFDKRGIAQLFMNSLTVENFNNVFGKLWYLYEMKNEYLKFIEFKLEEDFFLKLNVVVLKENKEGIFALTQNGTIKTASKGDGKRYDYKHENNREHIDIVNITSYKNFAKTKLGVFCDFWIDMKKNLNKYITLSLKELEMTTEKIKIQPFSITDIENVIVLDYLEPESYMEEKKAIVNELQKLGVTAKLGTYQEGEYHIALIHEKKYYENCSTNDAYKNDNGIVQHITIENFLKPDIAKKDNESDEEYKKRKEYREMNYQKTLSLVLKNILYELRIKKDLYHKELTITKWEKEKWNFVIRKYEKNKKTTYHKLTICEDGKMHYDCISENNELMNDEWLNIVSAYNCAPYIPSMIDGVFYKDIDRIGYIVSTNGRAFVNAENIQTTLKKLSKKVSTSFLLSLKGEFLKEFPDYKEQWGHWEENFTHLPEQAEIKDITKTVNLKSKAGKTFASYVEEHYDIMINGGLRSKDNDFLYSYSSLEGLQYALSEDGFFYFVGEQNGKKSCARFNVIRHVITDDITMSEFISFLKVPFVRNNNYTVLPYPFKFLRELAEN